MPLKLLSESPFSLLIRKLSWIPVLNFMRSSLCMCTSVQMAPHDLDNSYIKSQARTTSYYLPVPLTLSPFNQRPLLRYWGLKFKHMYRYLNIRMGYMSYVLVAVLEHHGQGSL